VFPRDVPKVRVGQMVEVVAGDGAQSAQSTVIYVAPLGTRANQTVTARVLLDNTAAQWSPGLYVTALVAMSEIEASVAVRNSAVQTLNGNPVVFVATEGEFEPRTVRVGKRDSHWTQILEGVQPGESYVAANSFILKAELGKGSAEHEH
jgi:membrane fusion protein, heavy metal efflux system